MIATATLDKSEPLSLIEDIKGFLTPSWSISSVEQLKNSAPQPEHPSLNDGNFRRPRLDDMIFALVVG